MSLILICFGVLFWFLLILPHPHKKQCYPEAGEGAQRSMGAAYRPRLSLLPLSSCFLWFPSLNLRGAGGEREKFLIAPRGTAPRPGALSYLCHPHIRPHCLQPWEGWSRMQAFPRVASCSCSPGCRSLELSSEGFISTLTSPVRIE